MNKNVLLIVFFGIILFGIAGVHAEKTKVCMDSLSLCTKAYIINGYWYCDTVDIVSCPRVWDPINQMWLGGCSSNPSGDDFCANTTSPIPPPACSQGDMQCGTTNTYDPNGDVYECSSENGVDGWHLYESCGDFTCLEYGTHAYCDTLKYWCTGLGTCFLSSVKNSNCYDSQAACESNLGFCCKNTSTNVWTWRTGSCLSNEIGVLDASINEANCKLRSCILSTPEQCNILGIDVCTEKICKDCGWNYLPSTILGIKYGGKCTNETVLQKCADCDAFALSYLLGGIWKAKSCDAKGWTLQWSFFFLKPPQNSTFCLLSLIKLILIPIVFVFSFLFLNQLLEDKFRSMRGKQGLWYRIIISVIFSALIAVLVYLAFIVGLVIFILVVLIRTAIPIGMTYLTKGAA